MKMTIKTGDNVLVITGKDKGKTGKVSAVYADSNRVVVENVNVVTKHQKPRTQQDKGGIIKKSAPIEASNVMVICPVCGKATRVSHKVIDGKKVRTCKKCGASLDKAYVKQTKAEAKKVIKASELKGSSLKAAKSSKKANDEVKEQVVEEVKQEEVKKPVRKSTKTSAEKSTSTTKSTSKTTAKTTSKSSAKSSVKKSEEAATENKETTTKKATTKKSTSAKKETK